MSQQIEQICTDEGKLCIKCKRAICETAWGSILPKPILDTLQKKIPLKYLISIIDKVRNFKWITKTGKVHIDSFAYCYDVRGRYYRIFSRDIKYPCGVVTGNIKRLLVIETSKYIHLVHQLNDGTIRYSVINRARYWRLGGLEYEVKLTPKEFLFLFALILLNKTLNEREIKLKK